MRFLLTFKSKKNIQFYWCDTLWNLRQWKIINIVMAYCVKFFISENYGVQYPCFCRITFAPPYLSDRIGIFPVQFEIRQWITRTRNGSAGESNKWERIRERSRSQISHYLGRCMVWWERTRINFLGPFRKRISNPPMRPCFPSKPPNVFAHSRPVLERWRTGRTGSRIHTPRVRMTPRR
jgi:hypothetical protein